MNKEEIEKLKYQAKLELLYGALLFQTEIDTQGMHKITIQTVCNPKVLLKVLEHIEKLEAALAVALETLNKIKDQENIYSEGCECDEEAIDCLDEISKIKGEVKNG